MTVFDRLEAQLLDAHPRRARRALPRPAPRHGLALAAAAAAIVAILVAGLAGDSGTGSGRSATQPGSAVAPVVPAHTNVAVLNATRSPGRAREVATALISHGWRISRVTNYPGAPLSSSCVDFTPGNSAAASMIAAQLSIDSVVPPSAGTVAAAGADAQVIVIVGQDRIQQVR